MITFIAKKKLMSKEEDLLVNSIIKGIEEVKGHEVVLMDLQSITQSISDYFIICSGDSPIQVRAIVDSIEKTVKETTNELPWKIEGMQNRQWVIMDYFDIVVHVFHKDWRSFYRLEDLWGDAEIKHYKE